MDDGSHKRMRYISKFKPGQTQIQSDRSIGKNKSISISNIESMRKRKLLVNQKRTQGERKSEYKYEGSSKKKGMGESSNSNGNKKKKLVRRLRKH